jgi:D-alanyl-D-alanine dipeptidase
MLILTRKLVIIAIALGYIIAPSVLANIVNPADDIKLPDGFVYLHRVDPSIITDIRYAKDNNPLGRPLKGYNRDVAILTEEAAEALKNVQAECRERGYTLVVYDAYRPKKSIQDLMEWAQNSSDQKSKSVYYPYLAKADLIVKGYIDEKSAHCRGSSVDVTITPEAKGNHPVNIFQRMLQDGTEITYQDDGTLDMGTSYHFFDDASAYNSPKVKEDEKDNRQTLRDLMTRHGFQAKDNGWWQYTFALEPFPDTCFDFDAE